MYVKTGLQSYCDTSYPRGDVNQMWILQNSKRSVRVHTIQVPLALATLKILFVCLALPTHTISRWVGRQGFSFLHLKALYFQTGFSQEHRGRYDINESNLMQHKEQQKSNSIFIKKNIFCLSVRQLNSEIRVLSIKSGNLTLNEKQR